MRRAERFLTLAVLAGLATACDDDGTGPPPPELPGVWAATKVEFVRVADADDRFDLVAEGGSFTLTLDEAGTFTLDGGVPGDPPTSLAGTWTAMSDEMTWDFTAGMVGTWQFAMSFGGDTLTLSGADTEAEFDDDPSEPAKLNLAFSRAS